MSGPVRDYLGRVIILDNSEAATDSELAGYVPTVGGGAIEDTADAAGHALRIRHNGNGSKNSGQTYALDIQNREGATSALVIHQYSNVAPMVVLDNTDSQPILKLHNTQNTTLNPDGDGTGDFIEFADHGSAILRIDKDLVFRTASGTKGIVILNTKTMPLSVQTPGNFIGLDVQKSGTGVGAAVRIINKGTDPSVSIRGVSAELARITAAGEFEHLTAGSGLLLRSPDGTRYRVTVANGGTVTAVAA